MNCSVAVNIKEFTRHMRNRMQIAGTLRRPRA